MINKTKRSKASQKPRKNDITARFDQALKTNTAEFIKQRVAVTQQKIQIANLSDVDFNNKIKSYDDEVAKQLEKAKPEEKEAKQKELTDRVEKIKEQYNKARVDGKNLKVEDAIKIPAKVKVVADKETGALVESDDGQEMDVTEFLAKDTAIKTGQKVDGKLVEWALKKEGGWRTKAEKEAGITKSVSDVWLAEGQRRAGIQMPKDNPNTPIRAELTDSNQLDPNKVDPNKVDPNKVDPNKVDPNKVDPNSPVDPKIRFNTSVENWHKLDQRITQFQSKYKDNEKVAVPFNEANTALTTLKQNYDNEFKVADTTDKQSLANETYVTNGSKILDDAETKIGQVVANPKITKEDLKKKIQSMSDTPIPEDKMNTVVDSLDSNPDFWRVERQENKEKNITAGVYDFVKKDDEKGVRFEADTDIGNWNPFGYVREYTFRQYADGRIAHRDTDIKIADNPEKFAELISEIAVVKKAENSEKQKLMAPPTPKPEIAKTPTTPSTETAPQTNISVTPTKAQQEQLNLLKQAKQELKAQYDKDKKIVLKQETYVVDDKGELKLNDTKFVDAVINEQDPSGFTFTPSQAKQAQFIQITAPNPEKPAEIKSQIVQLIPVQGGQPTLSPVTDSTKEFSDILAGKDALTSSEKEIAEINQSRAVIKSRFLNEKKVDVTRVKKSTAPKKKDDGTGVEIEGEKIAIVANTDPAKVKDIPYITATPDDLGAHDSNMFMIVADNDNANVLGFADTKNRQIFSSYDEFAEFLDNVQAGK